MATKNTTGTPTLAEAEVHRAALAARAAERAVAKRDDMIRAAIKAGASRRQVATATGIPTMTVQGIVRRGDREATS